MAYPPAVSDFKARFTRDFQYSPGADQIVDADIQNALNDAVSLFNQSLWSSATETTTAFLFLAAHMLVMNLRPAGGPMAVNVGKGARSGGGGVVLSKSVGSVSLTYAIPQRIQNSPILGPFMRTDYGQRYLQMLAPRLVGNVAVAAGPVDSDVADPVQAIQVTQT
jgi:hypothetical protein